MRGRPSVRRAGPRPLPAGSVRTACRLPACEIEAIRDAILAGAPAAELAALPAARRLRGALVKADEVEMFAGVASEDKDPRKSTHVEQFPMPELAPDEAYVAVMASGDQLQHGLDVDLRAAADVRLPEAPRPRRACGARATTSRST